MHRYLWLYSNHNLSDLISLVRSYWMHELWYIGKDFKQHMSVLVSYVGFTLGIFVWVRTHCPYFPVGLLFLLCCSELWYVLHNFSPSTLEPPKAVNHCRQATKLEILKLQNNVLLLFAVTTNLSTSPRLDCIHINQELWFTSHRIPNTPF